MQRSKAESYLGFARRAGKLAFGTEGAGSSKNCSLLLLDPKAGETSKERAMRLQKRFSCPLVLCEGVGKMAGREGCVLVAVRDESFAKIVREALEGQAGQEVQERWQKTKTSSD